MNTNKDRMQTHIGDRALVVGKVQWRQDVEHSYQRLHELDIPYSVYWNLDPGDSFAMFPGITIGFITMFRNVDGKGKLTEADYTGAVLLDDLRLQKTGTPQPLVEKPSKN